MADPSVAPLGERLKKARRARGRMSQIIAAAKIGVSQPTVSNVERGSTPSEATRVAMERWLLPDFSTASPLAPAPPPGPSPSAVPHQAESTETAAPEATETAAPEAPATDAPAPAPSPAPAPVFSSQADDDAASEPQYNIVTPEKPRHPQEDVAAELERLQCEIEELRTFMAPAADGRVRVASWNIWKLKYEGTDVEKLRIVNLAASIIGGNFDVVVIQEVLEKNGQDAVDELRNQLGDKWQSTLSDKTGYERCYERYAVLWRTTFSQSKPDMHLINNMNEHVDRFKLSDEASKGVRAFWRQFGNDADWPDGSRGFCFISFKCLDLLTFHLKSHSDVDANKCEVVALQAIATAAKKSLRGKALVVCGDANVAETDNLKYWKKWGCPRIGSGQQTAIFTAFDDAFGDPALPMEAGDPTNLFPIAADPKHNDVMFAAHCGAGAPDSVLVNGGTAPIPSAVVEAAGKSGASEQNLSIERKTRKYRGATNAAKKVWSDHRPVYCDVSLPPN